MEQSAACGLHCTKINHIGVKFGKEVILKDVNIHIHCGQLTVIIGRNGAGKSTLLKAILGEVEHTGNITFIEFDAPKDIIMARLKKREKLTTITDGRIEIAEKQRKTSNKPKADLTIITTGNVDDNIEEIKKFLIK